MIREAVPVTSFPFPIQRAIRLNPLGEVEALFPEHIFSRSQDLQEAYHDAGQFYWGRREAWLEGRNLFSERGLAHVLPRYRVVDIDTDEDWRLAELLYQALQDYDAG